MGGRKIDRSSTKYEEASRPGCFLPSTHTSNGALPDRHTERSLSFRRSGPAPSSGARPSGRTRPSGRGGLCGRSLSARLIDDVLPGQDDGASDRRPVRGIQLDVRPSLATPCPARGGEHTGMRSHELPLFLRRELHRPPFLIPVQRAEDSPVRPEIRVSHVSTLGGSLHAEREVAKIFGSHRRPCSSALGPLALLSGADGPKELVRADEDLAVRDGR
jgi:hypothetical protein